ncbi:MAG: PKD domain-containing protein [Bacteroidota bacterium]|jgi:gliding motility-associated-like protein
MMRLFLHILLLLLSPFLLLAGDKSRFHPVHAHTTQQGLHFKENKNQWHPNVLYAAELNGAIIFLERTGITYVLYDRDDLEKMHPAEGPVTVHAHAYKAIFEGAQHPSQIDVFDKSETYYNYFIGNDPAKWASDVHGFGEIYYHDIYPGIDIRFYFANGLMKYDFIVGPGADAGKIKISYSGIEGMKMKNNNLYINTSVGDVIEMAPVSWTLKNSTKEFVNSEYRLSGNTLQFNINKYPSEQSLVIDPTLIFSTYTGSTADNFGFTCTYDESGNMYLGGYVNGPIGLYPTTPGAFQLAFGGGTNTTGIQFPCDMGISKISADGTTLIYSTYLGGNDNETPHSLVVNNLNQLVIYGRTYSANFPVTPNAYDNSYNGGGDITITVMNVNGTGLVGSTFIGGTDDDGVNFNAQEFIGGGLKRNYGDDARGEVICDNNNNIYVASCTFSGNFPTSNTAIQNSLSGGQEGCVFKLNATASALLFSTYLGGTADDACYSLDLTATNTIYVTGGTSSSNFPIGSGGLNNAYQGGTMDGFLVHLNATGSAIINGTYIGTNQEDQSYFVKLDLGGNVYIVGQTKGNYPIQNAIYSVANSGQFITKLAPNLNSITYSTRFGSGNNDTNLSPTAFLVDTCENVYVCGWGGNLGFSGWPFNQNNISGMPVTADAFKSTTDGNDFYIIVIKKDAESLLYASYFGGDNALEHVDGGTSRFDRSGIIYEAVCAGCGGNSSTPTTPGVVSETNNSSNCNELGFKIALELTTLKAEALADPAATGCAPLTVNFINNSENATSYFWDFGTGVTSDTSNQFQPTFTYTDTGSYTIQLIAFSTNGCIPSDTAYTTVVVFNTNATADYSYLLNDLCDSLIVNFSAQGSSPAATYQWDFGDGTTGSGNIPSHTYYDAGVYTVTLIVNDTTACNPLDTFTQTIPFTSRITASPSGDYFSGCAPLTVQFENNSIGGTTFKWEFGDGSTSTLENPSHNYNQPGTYNALFIIFDPASCNGSDTAIITVEVFESAPVAQFTVSSQNPGSNEPVQFTNQSFNATNYLWFFNDGGTSNDVNPVHSFTNNGEYLVCLIAFNNGPCPDTACRLITVRFTPVIDVPNAFSPNGDGQNDILLVKGRGVQSIVFRVFNRWGEKVFESNDLNFGWDGTFKGEPQEMDVYAWTLNAVLDGNIPIFKSGNATLIR